jgi:hypothetical protein
MKKAMLAVLAVSLLGAGPVAAQTAGVPSSGTAPGGAFTISAEALLWWLKDSPAPVPLVTDGLLGEPGTRVFLGGKDIDTNPNPGVRLNVGYAFTPRFGLEGSAFYLLSRTTRNSVSSSGQPGSVDLKLPYFDTSLPGENASNLSSVAGSFRGDATERLENNFLGADLNGTINLVSTGGFRLDALAGARYLRLRETYTFDTSSPFIPPAPADVFTTKDEFEMINSFYGGQLGARARGDWGAFFLNGTLKVGLGAMVQSADVSGVLVTNDFNDFGEPQTFPGSGLFTSPALKRTHSRTVFAVVPEVNLTAGWKISRMVSVFVGYTFMYVSNVVRPGEQIDRAFDPVALTRPRFKFQDTDFWAQGLNVGLGFGF